MNKFSIRTVLKVIFFFAIFTIKIYAKDLKTYNKDKLIDLTQLSWNITKGIIKPENLKNKNLKLKKIDHFPIVIDEIYTSKKKSKIRTFTLFTHFFLDKKQLSNGRLAINLAGIGENWRIYINQNLIQDEMYIQNEKKLEIYRHMRGITIPIKDAFLKKNNLLLIQIAGYSAPTSFFNNIFLGLTYTKNYYIGDEDALKKDIQRISKLVLHISYIFFGIYHLFIFVRNRTNLYNLYFGLFTIFLSIYFFSISGFSFSIFKNTKYVLLVINTSQIFAMIFFKIFIHDFLYTEKRLNNLTLFLISLNIPYIIAFLIFPVYWYTTILFLWYFVLVPQLLNVVFIIIRAYTQKKEDSLVVLLAIFQGVIFVSWDILDTIFFKTSLRLLQYSFIIMSFSFVFILANRFMRWYQHSIELNRLREEQLYQDMNSGLPNRRKLIKDSKKFNYFSIIDFQIEGLARLNNIYGHTIVDEILSDYFATLKNTYTTNTYKIYRLNWNEFCFVCLVEMDYKELFDITTSVIKDLESWKSTKEGLDEIILDVVAGITNSDQKNIIKKLKESDDALVYAKERKLPFVFYEKYMDTEETHKNNLLWINEVRKAIIEERILIEFQAIQNNKNQTIEKYEALVRIRERDGNMISPGLFIPAITESKLFNDLTHKIIEMVCYSLVELPQECSININAEQLINYNLSELILKYVDECNIQNKLVIEILESERIKDYNLISKKLNLLRENGVKIAIDDFGTGYSNFEHIAKLPIDFIKIDGTLVKNIHTDHVSKILVENIVTICYKLNIKTIAEFVHCKEVNDVIISLGVDYSQGYYIAKPTPITKIQVL